MGRNDLEDIAILVGLGIVGVLAYQKYFPGKSFEEVVTELDKSLRGFLDTIKLPALPEIPSITPPAAAAQPAISAITPPASPPSVPQTPPSLPSSADETEPTQPAAEPTNTADTESDTRPKVNNKPDVPKDSGQVATNKPMGTPPSGAEGTIVAFAGDFDNNNNTKATMQSMDKNNVSMIIGAGDYSYSGSSSSWYNSVIGGTRFKGKIIGAKGNHDDGAYATLFGQPSFFFQQKVAPNLAVVVIPASSSVDEAKLTQLTQQAKASAKHVAYVFHEPYITSANGHHGPGECKAGPTIDKVAKANGVKLIVAGHNHIYEHFMCGGIHYVTSGAAGRKFYPGNCKNTCAPQKCAENTNGFLKVAVGATLRCQFIANSGQILDTFDVQ